VAGKAVIVHAAPDDYKTSRPGCRWPAGLWSHYGHEIGP
jgi:Cu/Zn superoxide dismutase